MSVDVKSKVPTVGQVVEQLIKHAAATSSATMELLEVNNRLSVIEDGSIELVRRNGIH